MAVYALIYEQYQQGLPLQTEKDILFEIFMKGCSQIMGTNTFFFLCCVLYVYPMYFFSKRKLDQYWFYGVLMFVISFSFYAYGTNGIRNGLATSLFLAAVTLNDRKNTIALLLISVAIHQSLVIPVAAYLIALFYRDILVLLLVWLTAIPLSLALGSFWEQFFMGLGLVEEQRIAGYLGGSDLFADEELKVGFRWDFLLYSATGIAAIWYYCIKKKLEDKFYQTIAAVYIISNTLWILVIRANFSNRIAYLSWFLLAAIIIYPLARYKIFKNQHPVVGTVIAIYFLFTYIVSVVFAK